MIYEKLDSALKYGCLNKYFPAAFLFLQRTDLNSLMPGKYNLDKGLFAIVVDGEGLGEEKAELESHNSHIDIHYTVMGKDRIGWKPTSNSTASKPYDLEKDTTFYSNRPEVWLDVAAGYFALFFPDDAHATMAGTGRVKKVIMKVQV